MKESKVYQEILAEGEVNGQRRAVMSLIEKRFGKKAANSLRGSLAFVDNPKQLDHLLLLASSCGMVDEIKRELPQSEESKNSRA